VAIKQRRCDRILGSQTNSHETLRRRNSLSPSEKTVLSTFEKYLVTPGKMLCFFGPDLERHRAALLRLTERELLVKEQFKGAYSLTHAGFKAMKSCNK
jgi:hypothetical protein